MRASISADKQLLGWWDRWNRAASGHTRELQAGAKLGTKGTAGGVGIEGDDEPGTGGGWTSDIVVYWATFGFSRRTMFGGYRRSGEWAN